MSPEHVNDILDVLDWITYVATKAVLIYIGARALLTIRAGFGIESWASWLVLLALAVIGGCGLAAALIRYAGG